MMLGGRYGARVDRLRRERTPRGGQPWSQAEDQELIDSYREGLGPTELAVRHGRTPAACLSRLVYRGVLVAHEGAYWELPPAPYITVREMMNMKMSDLFPEIYEKKD